MLRTYIGKIVTNEILGKIIIHKRFLKNVVVQQQPKMKYYGLTDLMA